MEGRALHRPGSAHTSSAGLGTVPEYWAQQNVPKVGSVRKANTFSKRRILCVFLQYLVSDADRFRSSARTFAWSEPGWTVPIRSSARPAVVDLLSLSLCRTT
jgi:hypothetical protein